MPVPLRAALGILVLLGLLVYGGPLPALCLVWGFAILTLQGTAGREPQGPSASPGAQPQEEARNISNVPADEPDAPVSSQTGAKEALEKVFDCVYAHLLSPWYDAPEPMKEQPLYKRLHAELMAAVDAIVMKTAHITRTQVLVGLIKNLTLHLHGFSKKTVMLKKPLFQTEVEEVEFFRRCTKELIAYLLPSSLAGPHLAEIFLTEILAVKVFKPTVNMLADPDFLNQNFISQITPEAPKQSRDHNNPTVRSRSLKAISGAAQDDKVDGNLEDEGSEDEDNFLEADGPLSSEERSDQTLYSNMWKYLFEGLYDDWNRHRWKATVSGATALPILKIHVEDVDQPTEIQWNILRTVDTVLELHEILSKDFPVLKEFQLGSLFKKQNWIEIEGILNSFLERLVFIIQSCQNDDALCFLLPIDLSSESLVISDESSDEIVADGVGHDESWDIADDESSTLRSLQNPPKAQIKALETAFNLLLREIIGNCLSYLQKLFSIQKDLPKKLNDMFNKIQWETYIDSLREILWPNGKPAAPLPIRKDKEKDCTAREAEKLLINMCPKVLVRRLWKSKAKHIFSIFQEIDQNKILICRWLLFVLDTVIPREERSWNVDDILTFT